jgi:CubicO group peptidase (beta-lactamase class C family)
MFVTAGQVVAEVSGKSWDDYVREKIFLPLGMKSTVTSPNAYRPGADWAFPHAKVDGQLKPLPFENLDNVGPAGSIISSVADLSQWMLVQLNHGKMVNNDARLFSEKSGREMWSQQSIIPVNPGSEELKALRPHFAGCGITKGGNWWGMTEEWPGLLRGCCWCRRKIWVW